MKKYISLFKLSFKRIIANFPAIIAGTLIIVVAAFALVFGLYTYTSDSRKTSITSANIGLVKDDTSDYANMALTYLESVSSVKDLVEFTIYETEADAIEALNDGLILAYAYMPEGFIESVMDGDNYPLKLVVGDLLPDTGAGYFFDIIDAAASDVATAQAAIYSVERIAKEAELPKEDRKKINSDINDVYISSFLHRERMYDNDFLGNGKGLTIQEYYGCSLVMIILMLSGISFNSILKSDSRELMSSMRRANYPLMNAFNSVLISSGLFTILISVLYMVLRKSFINPLYLLLIVFSIFAFNSVIYRLFKEETTSMLTICASSFFLIFICGALVSISFLPNLMIDIGHNTHIGITFDFMKHMISDSVKTREILITLVYSVVFILISTFLDHREVQKA